MKKWLREEIQVKILCIGMLGLLVAILIPLFWISVYNFKCVDDLAYARVPEQVWAESHSVIKVLAGQVVDTWRSYMDWQGTYFGLWFYTSMIGIFGESAYYVGTILSLGGFVAAEMFLFMTVLVKGLGADKCRAAILASGCVAIQVLLTPYPVEAFFWFCGAVLYTSVHALSLLLLTLLFLFLRNGNEKRAKTIWLEIGIVMLTIAVGGSNYVTALLILILYVLAVGWTFWHKNPCRWIMLCNLLLYLFAFGLNVLAPGNRVRQTSSGMEHMSAVESIFLSLKEAAVYCLTNLNAPCVILGLLFLPVLLAIVRKRNYKYPMPLLVSVLAFGIYAAQFTPTLYALHIIGAGRVQNLYRFNFYVLVYGLELYWIGWFWRKWREQHATEVAMSVEEKKPVSYLLSGWLIGGIVLCMSLALWGGSTITSVSAIQSLRRGEAQQYCREYQERLVLLKDDTVKDVYLQPFSMKPYLLFFGDVQVDAEDWVNQSMANYYGKESIRLKE